MHGEPSLVRSLFLIVVWHLLQTTARSVVKDRDLDSRTVPRTTVDIARCLLKGVEMKFVLNASEIRVQYNHLNTGFLTADDYMPTCRISATSSAGHVVSVLVLEQSCVAGNEVVVVDTKNFNNKSWNGCERQVPPGPDFVSQHTDVTASVIMRNRSVPFSVRLSIREIPKQDDLMNILRFVSSSMGYTQSAHFDIAGYMMGRRETVDCWTEVGVPHGHVTMISLVYLAMPYDSNLKTLLGLFEGQLYKKVWERRHDQEPLPDTALLNSTVFHVQYQAAVIPYVFTDTFSYLFRILFSFHEASPSLLRLSSGRRNCSLNAYPEFQAHLQCNLKQECDDGRDELEGCPYTLCVHSGVQVAGRCFFHPPLPNGTLSEPVGLCAGYGAKAASLNTPEKLSVLWLLRLYQFQGLTFRLGLSSSSGALPRLYRDIHQWEDTTLAYFLQYRIRNDPPLTGEVTLEPNKPATIRLERGRRSFPLCELRMDDQRAGDAATLQSLSSSATFSNTSVPLRHVTCPRGHLAHDFLACDLFSACFSANSLGFSDARESWAIPSKAACSAGMTSLPPSFTCADGTEHVPYSMVCDYRQDCLDDSDEGFCVLPSCDVTWQFQCENKQCISLSERCNAIEDCHDRTDEVRCETSSRYKYTHDIPAVHPPAIVTLDGRGYCNLTRMASPASPCPDTHFRCSSIDYCLPVYLRCNGVNDCPEKEDEAECRGHGRTCPGFYRCRGFRNTCLHPDHLCDGLPQCPQHDDEVFCSLACPAQCTCLGHSWRCRREFLARLYPNIRFLDAGHSGMKPSRVNQNTLLIHLSLSHCGLTGLDDLTLPNLHSLILHDNRIQTVTYSDLEGLPNLDTLFLSGNALTSVFASRGERHLSFPQLTRLDLSTVNLLTFDPSVLASFSNLQTLNLSGCGTISMPSSAFRLLPHLRVLDVRGCPLRSLPTGMLKPLTRLRAVRADNFKVCCPLTVPDSFRGCESPTDRISSCSDLFKSSLHRTFWSVATALIIIFNAATVVKRLWVKKKPQQVGSRGDEEAMDAFVTAVFVCGCIHAVYMSIIGVADADYRGRYALKDTSWRHGALCAAAGALWLFSIELARFLCFLLTLDRILVSGLPSASWRFSGKSAAVAIGVCSVGSAMINLAPLLPSSPTRKLFRRTALCAPLLFAGEDFPGRLFLSGVFAAFNVTLCWVVVLGQMLVYLHLRRNRFAFIQSPDRTKGLSASRRVMALVLCDVAFWLVIGHASQLVATGASVSDDLAVSVQALAIPLDWALKPVLHVALILLERRQREREERIVKILIAKRHK